MKTKRKKRKGGRGKRIGGAFERKMAKRLSLWWTNGERDDVLWRSHSSGARATIRHKQGKTTKGQDSDLTATDPIAKPLIDVATIELKKNLSQVHLSDVFDKLKGQRPWEEWFMKVRRSYMNAKSATWWIIHQRSKRKPVIYFPRSFWKDLQKQSVLIDLPNPSIIFTAWLNIKGKNPIERTIVALLLDDFLNEVKPKHILKIAKEHLDA